MPTIVKSKDLDEIEPQDLTRINDRLFYIIKILGITQRALCREIDFKTRTLNTYLNTEHLPSTEFLIKIHNFYNVNINWVLFGEGKVFMEKPKDKPITHDEKNLIRYYRLMSNKGKDTVLGCLKLALKNNQS